MRQLSHALGGCDGALRVLLQSGMRIVHTHLPQEINLRLRLLLCSAASRRN
jgi:hypothetical protein